jgi:hypothetical protein
VIVHEAGRIKAVRISWIGPRTEFKAAEQGASKGTLFALKDWLPFERRQSTDKGIAMRTK